MAIFRDRLPSRHATGLVLLVCIVPIHVWAMIAVLRAIPSWVLALSVGEMIAVMAYPLVFALLESLLMLAGLFIAAVVLPAGLYRKRFVSQSIIVVLLAMTWAILMQFNGQAWGLWSPRMFLVGLVPLVLAIALSSALNARFKGFQESLNAFAERLQVLAIVYIVFDFLFLAVILVRNFA